MHILNIAEKASVARTISTLLSSHITTTQSPYKYTPNLRFTTTLPINTHIRDTTNTLTFTSVSGHLSGLDFVDHQDWASTDPKLLFTAPVVRTYTPDNMKIAMNIRTLSRGADMVIIWTDCDREGENIAKEIMEVALEGINNNSNNRNGNSNGNNNNNGNNNYFNNRNVPIKRARFNALTRTSILDAFSNLDNINMRESNAVDARIELDLRLGAAFTRLQTLAVRDVLGGKGVVSYGSCQIPTLGFVVERMLENDMFVAEKYYGLKMCVGAKSEVMKYVLKNIENGGKNNRCKSNVENNGKNNGKTNNGKNNGKTNIKNNGKNNGENHGENNIKSNNNRTTINNNNNRTTINNTNNNNNNRTTINNTNNNNNNNNGTTITDDGLLDRFDWKRGTIYDKNMVVHMHNHLTAHPTATITKVISKPTQKIRPLPLRTVEFQKSCSSLFKLSSHTVMEIAEKLYNKGYISYPRTETDSFPKTFNFKETVLNIRHDYRPFIDKLILENEFTQLFVQPRRGSNDDMAHAPIYPLKSGAGLDGNERRIYDFIARRFLGCVARNAEGVETKIEAVIGREVFGLTGLVITARNYLEIYTYDKWAEKHTQEYRVNERVNLKNYSDRCKSGCVSISVGSTDPPGYLTEPELITLMDRHGIGTDATIAEHIQKIQTRLYCTKMDNRYFIATPLGTGLILGYGELGLESFAKPVLRGDLESRLRMVCEGRMEAGGLVSREIETYRGFYERMEGRMGVVREKIVECGRRGCNYVRNGDDSDDEGNDGHGGGNDDGGGGNGKRYNNKNGYNINSNGYNNKNGNNGNGYNNKNGNFNNKTYTNGNNGNSKTYTSGKNTNTCINNKNTNTHINKNTNTHINNNNNNTNKNTCTGKIKPAGTVSMKDDIMQHFEKALRNKNRTEILNTSNTNHSEEIKKHKRVKTKSENKDVSKNDDVNNISNEVNMTIKCKCRVLAKIGKVTKAGKNKGKEFYSCSKWPSGCDYFEWTDIVNENKVNYEENYKDDYRVDFNDNYRNDVDNKNREGVGIMCDCGFETHVKMANTEKNRGKKFYVCKKAYKPCNFFQWAE